MVSAFYWVALSAAIARGPAAGDTVQVGLSEWKVELSAAEATPGRVTFQVKNGGTIPHQFEVEGRGIERRSRLLQPGDSATLVLTLNAGRYEIYCPVGGDSHKKLGMETYLVVGKSRPAARDDDDHAVEAVEGIRVEGAGPVIQILPGPFPFVDSLRSVLPLFGDEAASIRKQAENGPYSDRVARIRGSFAVTAWDLGATRDSLLGLAEFTTADGTRWRLVLDRVQTKDVPHHPRFGGVIFGLYYHGNTGVHTPLVPTINSRVAAWGVAHLFRNDTLVTDDAQVHLMLLSRTRRLGDFALQCWDCSKEPLEELQLQVTPAPGEPAFQAPGGVLFVSWEKSSGKAIRQ
ncbi:MAG TPA: cupredoxin domain-containing protein [Gemmatimonadales bacterium]|nr:cupredoxin domain-containing protein [Gemmatimonadales bacterium]